MIPHRRQQLANRIVETAGWHFEGTVPDAKRFVCIAAPHTSNWDGLILVFVANSLGIELSWMVKDTMTRGPLEPFMRHFGAVPIDRRSNHNVVQQMIDEFGRRDELALAVPPEGTRSKREHWKSGFYYIATGAQVPVVPGYLDYARKVAGLGPAMVMSGNVQQDMERIRAFYAEKKVVARHPELVGPIRLRDEG